jgi:hypothetical protein
LQSIVRVDVGFVEDIKSNDTNDLPRAVQILAVRAHTQIGIAEVSRAVARSPAASSIDGQGMWQHVIGEPTDVENWDIQIERRLAIDRHEIASVLSLPEDKICIERTFDLGRGTGDAQQQLVWIGRAYNEAVRFRPGSQGLIIRIGCAECSVELVLR